MQAAGRVRQGLQRRLEVDGWRTSGAWGQAGVCMLVGVLVGVLMGVLVGVRVG